MKKLYLSILFMLVCVIFSMFITNEYPLDRFEENYSRLSNKIYQLENLRRNEYLESLNGNYRFIFQDDSNLFLIEVKTTEILWSSNTGGIGGARLVINATGRLVMRTDVNKPVWSVRESVKSGADSLVMNNDGSLVLYAGTTEVWSVNKGTVVEDSPYNHKLDGNIMVPEQSSMRILILKSDPDVNWNNSNSVLWSWNIKDAKGVPSNQKSKFKSSFTNLSDVKRVIINGKIHLVFCGSYADGVAIVDMLTKNVIYCNNVGGSPHAIALLPDGNLVIADPGKKQVRVFNIWKGNYKSQVQGLSHSGIHGVVWDATNQIMWAWGGSRMEAYSYNNNKLNPRLTSKARYSLPSSWGKGGGHDLAPMLGTTKLIFGWRLGIGSFDTKTKEFKQINNKVGNAKGLSYNPNNNEIIYTRPDSKDSRTYRVRSLSEKDRIMTGGKWYKVRWFIHNTFSYPIK